MASSTDRFDPDFVVRQVLKGNRDRFRLIVREYGLLVRGYLAARVYHLEDAEDLAQDAFLVAFSKLSTYEIGTNFRAWLLTIAKFQLTNHWRKTSRRANAMDRFRHDIAEAIQPDLQKLRKNSIRENRNLLDCIAKLPDRTRHLIRAGLDGVRMETLTEELNLKPNALYQLRHRAHQALRKCVEEQTPDPAS